MAWWLEGWAGAAHTTQASLGLLSPEGRVPFATLFHEPKGSNKVILSISKGGISRVVPWKAATIQWQNYQDH